MRTHQFNSAGTAMPEPELAVLLGQADRELITVRLSDRFGDDGIVGACVIDTGQAGEADSAGGADPSVAWRVPLLLMSCRAMGRGVIDALLAWLCRAAAVAGATAVEVPCLVTERNVPLRLSLAAAGFRSADPPPRDSPAIFARQLDGALSELPALPDWLSAPEQT